MREALFNGGPRLWNKTVLCFTSYKRLQEFNKLLAIVEMYF